jgi:NADP-dependent 3-hydroxy acid dehydrogenase YdfG
VNNYISLSNFAQLSQLSALPALPALLRMITFPLKTAKMAFPYKTVLIIGATSGIGLALAEKMMANGIYVIASGRRQENLTSLVEKHGEEKVASFKFDITDLKGIPGFVEK